MSAIWTAPTDPTAGDPATADYMRVNVTQNLRKLREDIDAITSGAVVQAGWKNIPSQTAWSTIKTIVEGSFTPLSTANMLLLEVSYPLRVVGEPNFMDQETRQYRVYLEHSTDGGSTWNRTAEYFHDQTTDPSSFVRDYSESVYLRAVVPSAASVLVRARHYAYADAGSFIAPEGGGVLTVMELEGAEL